MPAPSMIASVRAKQIRYPILAVQRTPDIGTRDGQSYISQKNISRKSESR